MILQHLLLDLTLGVIAWLVWLIHARPWTLDSAFWSETLVRLWRVRIHAFDEFMTEVEAGRQSIPRVRSVVGDPYTFEDVDEYYDWFIQRMRDDRFAVREADEVTYAESLRWPFRSELWIKYWLGVEGRTLRELATERGIGLPVLAFFAARFGIVPWVRVGESAIEVIGLPLPWSKGLARVMAHG